jgi:hypothetical protein
MIEATVAYAADPNGEGVAYTAVRTPARTRLLLRVPFRVKRLPALSDREVGYAAVAAVSDVLRARGIKRVRIGVDDPDLLADVCERRKLPAALTLPYVRLGCALNRFTEHQLVPRTDEDLAGRARAEALLHTAA